MRKNFWYLIVGLCVMCGASMTACSDKNGGKQGNPSKEITLIKNVQEGYAYHMLLEEVEADIDYGTGEFEENIINYQITEGKNYIGPKDFVLFRTINSWYMIGAENRLLLWILLTEIYFIV